MKISDRGFPSILHQLGVGSECGFGAGLTSPDISQRIYISSAIREVCRDKHRVIQEPIQSGRLLQSQVFGSFVTSFIIIT